MDSAHVGVFVDAVDKAKFTIPTYASQAKCLARKGRIKQKITGVQFFHDDRLILFRTLPDVRTGGNLTCTIIARLFAGDYFRDATDVYFNLDGASDNVCYTLLYGLAFLIHGANKSGWPLKRVHILRFKVNTNCGVFLLHVHTHKHTLYLLSPLPKHTRWDTPTTS